MDAEGHQVVPGSSIIEDYWAELDRLIDLIKEKTADPSADLDRVLLLRERARGVAFCIQRISRPYYETENDVLRQAQRRYVARRAGEEVATPGCLGYDPQPAVEHAFKASGQSIKPGMTVSSSRRGVSIDSAVAEAMRVAFAAGAFSPEQLAKIYALPLVSVQAVLNQATLDMTSPTMVG